MKGTITTTLDGEITSENIEKVKNQLSLSMEEGSQIKVCCGNVHKTDLAGFNAMIMAYMTAVRSNKQLTYVNCKEPKLVDFISQTHFNHVFVTQ